MRKRAAAKGRSIRFGIRLHFIVVRARRRHGPPPMPSSCRITDEQIERAQARFLKEMDSVGQRRMAALHGGRRDRLVVAPNLWAGVGLVRSGAGTALVGTPLQVAERLREYQEAGIDTVIGSGYPIWRKPTGWRNCCSPPWALAASRASTVAYANEFA